MKKLIGLFIAVAVIILVAYQALMFYDNNFRYGRMRETPGVKPHETPLLVLEAGIVPIHGGGPENDSFQLRSPSLNASTLNPQC